MNCIGSLIFERGRRGDLDFSVSTRRVGPATTITVYHPDGVMTFTFTDDELAAAIARRDPDGTNLIGRHGVFRTFQPVSTP
jgi:hypothetical protein